MSARQTSTHLKKLRAENSKLKAENNRLKKQASKPSAKKQARQPLKIARKAVVIFLVSLAVALLTVGNLLFWFGNTVVKQDRYVAATEPVIKDPVVQQTMALYTTNQIFSNIDVQKVTESVLPPRADFLAPQLTNQLKTYTQTTLQKLVARPSFHDKWNQSMARQHDRIINFATKYQGDGDISVNDVFNQLTSNLSDTKLAFLSDKQLPPKVGDINVISAAWLPTFHNVVVNIDTWRLLTLIILILTLVGAIWLSVRRRRTVYIFSLASALMLLATLIALRFFKEAVAEKAKPEYQEGVRHVMQIVIHPLVLQTSLILLVTLVILAIAWISGPSKSSTKVKEQVFLLFSGKLHEKMFASENRFTSWVGEHKRLLQWSIVAVLSAIILLTRLTLQGLIIYLVLMLILVLAVEVIGGQASKNNAR